jgi:hypothetical protein
MTTPFEDAVKAYQRYCKNNNLIYSQPSELLSKTGRKYVYLENINGDLGRYEIETGKILIP